MTKMSFEAAKQISERMEIPLHPIYTYYWTAISKNELFELRNWVLSGKYESDKLIIRLKPQKRSLELIGVPHKEVQKEFVVVEKDHAQALLFTLGPDKSEEESFSIFENNTKITDILTALSGVKIRDKSGTFIGARMGRPEKAKMRKLTGSPHAMFPVGEQGGRLRSFQSAMEARKIVTDLQLFKCKKCNNTTPFRVCELCNSKTEIIQEGEKKNPYEKSKKVEINIDKIMDSLKKRMDTKIIPDLIKGVRGLASKERLQSI
jgi:DNA polymerase II large subunit